jgi:methionyl-tRNA formyltransferase
MKIAALIGIPTPPFIYMVNYLHQNQGLSVVVIDKNLNGNTHQAKRKETSEKFSIEKLCRHYLFKKEWKKSQVNKREEADKLDNYYNELYTGLSHKIDDSITVLEVNDINSKETEKILKEHALDLIVDHGTTLLKSNILSSAPMALNLHWGLSPYYRGVDCTRRAIFNWDVNNIGVTIHKLSSNIDGGDILGQKRISLIPNDSVEKITARLTKEGTSILNKSISKMKADTLLDFHPQNFNHGFLIKNKYWNEEFESFFRKLDSKVLLKIISNPSRDEAPIIEL